MRLSFNGYYPVTTLFGVYNPIAYGNYPGKCHPGTDWGLPSNTQLVAGMSGTVSIFDRDPSVRTGRGKEVVITNGNKQRKTCHMNRIDVRNGQSVSEGQPIGLSGYTGYVVDSQGRVGTPDGAHLHDELLENGTYVALVPRLIKEIQEEEMPNDGDIVNFIRKAEGRRRDYQPPQEQVESLRHKTFKDWAYELGILNDGDITNSYHATDGRDPSAGELADYKNDGIKRLLYEQILPKTDKLRQSQGTVEAVVLGPGNYRVN